MRHFAQNEFTPDAISVAEHCYKGEVLNWLTFVLNELFKACEDIYKRSTNFIFGYILMTLAMWKWKPPKGRDLVQIREDQPIALRYDPYRTSWDPSSKEVNEAAFNNWYEIMLITIRKVERIPRELLYAFSQDIWFGFTHGHTYVRPRCVHPKTFQMRL